MSSLTGLTRLADRIDRVSTVVGRTAAWCLVFMVLTKFAVVVMRYVLGIGSIWLEESILYAHAALFMLAAAWTLRADAHVRVDIIYADARPRTKALVDGRDELATEWMKKLRGRAEQMLDDPPVKFEKVLLPSSREAFGMPVSKH